MKRFKPASIICVIATRRECILDLGGRYYAIDTLLCEEEGGRKWIRYARRSLVCSGLCRCFFASMPLYSI